MPENWRVVCNVLIYKGKKSKLGCKSYRSISLLRKTIPGKVYRKIIMQRVINETEEMISEEQCNIWCVMVCVDQVYVLRQQSEQACEEEKQLWPPLFCRSEEAYE